MDTTEKILEGIATVVDSAVSKAGYDRTIKATVQKCLDSVNGKYTVYYEGGTHVAYAQSADVAYEENQSVYVTIAGNNASNTVYIIGSVHTSDESVDYIDDAINDYMELTQDIIGDSGTKVIDVRQPSRKINLYTYGGSSNKITVDTTELQNAWADSDAIKIAAKFYTKELSRTYRMTTGHYGLEFTFVYKDASGDEVEKEPIKFDSLKNMTGTPLSYSTATEQYEIYTINNESTGETFDHIKSIDLYVAGFVVIGVEDTTCEANEADKTSPECLITVQEIELRCLDKIESQDGHRLKIACGRRTLDSTNTSTSATAYLYNEKTRVKVDTAIYWFQQNPQITSSSENYNVAAGEGWEQLNETATNTITFDIADMWAHKNAYRCVAKYNNNQNQATVDFYLYDETETRTIELTTPQTNVSTGSIALTCTVTPDDSLLEYSWRRVNAEGDVEYITVNNSTENILTYSVDKIVGFSIFYCDVYKQGHYLGSDSLKIIKNSADNANSYYMTIENGNVNHVYDSEGNLNENYTTVQLIAHLYDPQGNEVDHSNYKIEWIAPTGESMIKEISTENLDNNRCDYTLVPTYDNDAIDNQIQCKITYNEIVYNKITSFVFSRQGENGTNGTKYSIRINQKTEDDYFVFSNKDSNINVNDKLSIQLYENAGSQIRSGYSYSWRFAGDTFTVVVGDKITVTESGVETTYIPTLKIEDGSLTNEFVKGSCNQPKYRFLLKVTMLYDDKKYYAFYPMPYVKYIDEDLSDKDIQSSYTVKLTDNISNLLKEVIYNQSGRYPAFEDKNSLRDLIEVYKGTTKEDRVTVSWTAHGSLSIKNLSIIPNELFGNEVDNYVAGNIEVDGDLVATIYIPIYCHLNTYAVSSLNEWDGVSISINDEENKYIMAPQVGAGEKNDDNTFTGVLMGVEETYTTEGLDKRIGLFGYNHGVDQFFLNSEQSDSEPSHIGQWVIGDNYLYNDDSNGLQPYVKSNSIWYGPTVQEGDTPHGCIPHNKQGVMLSADYPYISVKGRLWTDKDPIGTDSLVKVGESLEVELDPNSMSMFTIWRHYQENQTWSRKRMVYIDNEGKFMVNGGIDSGGTALGAAGLTAFGQSKDANDVFPYIGLKLSKTIDSESSVPQVIPFARFFISNPNTTDPKDYQTSTLYISGAYYGGGTQGNEYTRPISVHGQSISLYAQNSETGSEIATKTDRGIVIDSNKVNLKGPATVNDKTIYEKKGHIQWGTGGTSNFDKTKTPEGKITEGDIWIQIVN